ncbi:phosphatase PAP2 family protein [Flavobacterium crassostreae]|uniref:Phosphatidic acid phosphatase n=1 Tax=Flavobacterium crassostreae TaxID=1763534 RepID=A0A1B9E4N6_9FLAO|nr:phosphatase PAP2 family protein [Flavobacterium crassostreae]OCB76889.1 phosphatidic acid phosphatase [Flavobacterium crassostreae]
MKKIAVLYLFSILAPQIYAQNADSLVVSQKRNYSSFIVPSVLVGSGVWLLHSKYNTTIQAKTNAIFGSDFQSKADNIFPLLPVGQMYLGMYLGLEPKTNFKKQTITIAMANTATVVVVELIKRLTQKERPDLSNNSSFPSGHTAVGFTNATLLFYQYKESHFWYASSGYIFAGATAVFRMANNKHFASDVLAGAGIGVASGIIFSNSTLFHAFSVSKKSKTTAYIYPQIGKHIGFGASIYPNF